MIGIQVSAVPAVIFGDGFGNVIFGSFRQLVDECGVLEPSGTKSANQGLVEPVADADFNKLHRDYELFAYPCIPDINPERELMIVARSGQVALETGCRQSSFDLCEDSWQARELILHEFPGWDIKPMCYGKGHCASANPS